jgi:phosphatidylinositol alpha-1,6-mannosyltransferase
MSDQRVEATQLDQPKRALLVTPSKGMGGGIERYVAGLESALQQAGVAYERLDLRRPGAGPPTRREKLAFAVSVCRALRRHASPTRLILAHPHLMPLVIPAARIRSYAGTTVVFHGIEALQTRLRGRRIAMRPDVRVLTVSSFTSGALAKTVNATVVAPFLETAWFDRLVAAKPHCEPGAHVRLLTVFRLADWEDKGLETLVEALVTLGAAADLLIVGSGEAPSSLRAFLGNHPWVQLKTGLADAALAAEYASADIFVLATRTRTGSHAYGEGFGLCLVEAQIAGTVVVAPAYGGSHDAFQAGMTGVAPVDESAAALARCLRLLLQDEGLRVRMSEAAAAWSRAAFQPDVAAKTLIRALL